MTPEYKLALVVLILIYLGLGAIFFVTRPETPEQPIIEIEEVMKPDFIITNSTQGEDNTRHEVFYQNERVGTLYLQLQPGIYIMEVQ